MKGLKQDKDIFMSSISSVTPAIDPYQATNLNAFVQFVNDFNAIGIALQSGDLPSAKSALDDFQQDLPHDAQTAKGQPFGANDQANLDYKTLVSALQGGDLPGAQSAYSNLQSDLEGGKTRRRVYYRNSGSPLATQSNGQGEMAEADLLLDATA